MVGRPVSWTMATLSALAAASGGCGEPFDTSGGAAGAGGTVVSACPGFGALDDGFETGLVTPLGEWVNDSDSGGVDPSDERWLAGSRSLVMRETDTTHNANLRVMMSIDLAGRRVDSLRVFNIASSNVPTSASNCATAYSGIELTDGVATPVLRFTDYDRPHCAGSSQSVVGNADTADGELVGADGNTWYEYCIDVPEDFDRSALRLRLIAEADGGDSHVEAQIESYWDVVQVLP